MAEKAAQLHVLLVEDSETDAGLVMRELRKHGFETSHERVESAAEMQAALVRHPWQLVISDSSVPRFGVLEALQLAKQFAPTVPFIVVSGTIREEVAVEAMRSGAADFITKENLQRLGPVVARELRRMRAGDSDDERGADRSIAHRLLAAQEAERRRIARSLHDEFGQLLTALRLTLAAAKTVRGAARNQRIDAGLAIVEEAVARVREVAVAMWPTVLDDFGLPGALRWLGERHRAWSGLEITVEAEDVGRLPFTVEIAAFHLVQEALTNATRHATARTIDIGLRSAAGSIEVSIHDDGAGFDVAAAWSRAATGPTLGLLGMRERVLLAGGELEIESSAEAGTTVRARFPVTVLER